MRRSLFALLSFCLVVSPPADAAQNRPPRAKEEFQRYLRANVFIDKDTWMETLLASRQGYFNYLKSGKFKADWMRHDARQGCLIRLGAVKADWAAIILRLEADVLRIRPETDKNGKPVALLNEWFEPRADTALERALIGHQIAGIERDFKTFAPVADIYRKRLDALIAGNKSMHDPAWLTAYDELRQITDSLASIKGVDRLGEAVAALSERFGADCGFDGGALLAKMAASNQTLAQQLSGDVPPKVAAIVRDYAQLIRQARYGLKPAEGFLAAHAGADFRSEWEQEWRVLEENMTPQQRAWFEKVAAQTFDRQSLVLPSDRDPLDVVLRRTAALLDDLDATPGGADRKQLRRQLAALRESAGEIACDNVIARQAVFSAVCALRRRIAFTNPLLGFDKILFVKRHFMPDDGGVNIQDQYLGLRAIGGGSLCVLRNPFSDAPAVDNLLKQPVSGGRLDGRKLEGGDFITPELDFDAQTIYFGYTEHSGPADGPQFYNLDYARAPATTYHIFRAGADGGGLRQLTDGPYNDSDPCVLPNGRVVFVSERRQGFARSSRSRTHTLHSMNPDGGDIVRISHHESNEFHPSVDPHGQILYTRWDYWDRGYVAAVNLWLAYPDGRDSRAIFANYAPRTEPYPNATASPRAVPGSNKIIGVGCTYYDQSYGTLVMVDRAANDEDRIAKCKRISPEFRFNWWENGLRNTGPACFASPWPLSERYHLAVYDPDARIEEGPKNNYGIYLVDAFGNRELLYRDPKISCLDPIPFVPRERPPVIPHKTHVGLPVVAGATAEKPSERDRAALATVGVVNVRESFFDIPKNVEIARLRVVQELPKTTSGRRPELGYGMDKGGRNVLGTVPVEKDGSAHFTMPVDIPVYFQLLDKDGLAVQTMRSTLYASAGETLFCMGCHDPRERAPSFTTPPNSLAFRRPPSPIQPEFDEARPLTFPRLIQPILDKHCVACHAKGKDKPSLEPGNWQAHPWKFYESYRNLEKYVDTVFNTHDFQNPQRSVPMTFGTRVSKLYTLLKNRHQNVALSDDELRRLALWMDNAALFAAECTQLEKQAQGGVVKAPFE